MTKETIKKNSSTIANGASELVNAIAYLAYMQFQRNQSICYVDPDLESLRYKLSLVS